MILLISIIGTGRVGSTIGFLCVSHALDDVLFVNADKEIAIGESLDVASAIPSSSKFSISATDDISQIKDSKIVIIAASMGVYTTDRAEHIAEQVNMIKTIADDVKKYCPSAIVLVVSNPLDVLTYYFQKQSQFSRFKVIGIASSLDSSRFRYHISEKLSVPQSSISDAFVLGEHGDSMVPIFSKVTINGDSLLSKISENDVNEITSSVRDYWKALRNHKSRSMFGIAKNVFDVINCIYNSQEMTVSAAILLENEYDESDIAMGIPVKINDAGISEIVTIPISEKESELLKISASKIRHQILSVSTQ